jgi:ribose transport system ATP-binding protein
MQIELDTVIRTTSEVSSTENPTPLLDMRGIARRFPGALALGNVDFDNRRGEAHALVGENGALVGKRANLTTPRQAQLAGITTIHQELNQAPQIRRCYRG